MKKTITTLCTLLFVLGAYAVNYCASSSWGYAGTVTGGGSASPTLVSSESELKNALKNSNSVIVITKDITVSTQLSIEGKSNITLLALPGKRLISNDQTPSKSGILAIKSSSTNIILRNLIFEGPGAFDCDGRDNLTVSDSRKIWVDHCDFQDGCDGNFDINGVSDNITVTWCRFRYLKAPRPRDAGDTNTDHTDDHRFSNLIGSSSSQKPSDGTYNITYGFCWWDEGCKQRMTRCRNCELHFLNCYWNSSVADYYVGPENAKCYFEGCTFAGRANSAKGIWSVYGSSDNSCKFVNCTGNLPANTGSVSAPSYPYDQLTAATAKNHVTNASCGAGATLVVTDKAEVSSSCDSGTGDDDDTPVAVEGQCCIDLSLGEEPTVANGGIPAAFSKTAVTASLSTDPNKGSKWAQGYLNMGANSDYITFDFSAYTNTIKAVSFDVTIPGWQENKNTVSYHWNTDANSSYAIAGSETETVSLSAPAGARSFTIQRSASTGTRFTQICFDFNETPSAVVSPEAAPSARKVLINGQIYIQKEDRVFTILGSPVH